MLPEEDDLRHLYHSPSVAAARKEAGLPDYVFRPPESGLEDLPEAPSGPAVNIGKRG